MNPNQKDWENVYKLEYPGKNCTKVNNQLYDFRYEKLEKFITNKFDLYDNNGIIQNYPSNLHSKLKNKKLYLYGRNLIGFNNEDVKEFSLDELISYETISNKHYSFIWIISLFALLFLIRCLAQAGTYNLNIISQREAQVDLLMTYGCIMIIFYTNFIVFVYNLRIQNIIVVEGNDDYTKENMKLFKSEIRMHYYFNLFSLILILILIFFIILFYKNNK